MGKSIDDIKEEIAKYESQIKRIKSVIPLVTMSVIAFIFTMSNTESLFLKLGLVVALCMYAGSFVWAYFKSSRKIKELEKQLEELSRK